MSASLHAAIALAADEAPQETAIKGLGELLTWHALQATTQDAVARLSETRPHSLGVSANRADAIAILAAAQALGIHAVLLPPALAGEAALAVCAQEGVGQAYLPGEIGPLPPTPNLPPPPPIAGDVSLFTSGTTGAPKRIAHLWQRLLARTHIAAAPSAMRWYTPFPISSFAGLQVCLAALMNRSSIYLGHDLPPSHAAAALLASRATHLSATPTFLRLLFAAAGTDSLRAVPLRQITLGGEIADQAILDKTRSVFPEARISHIYATSEAGVCFSVHDGRAGFPLSFLGNTALSSHPIIMDGELYIAAPTASISAKTVMENGQAYAATGDLVDVVGDRILFRGRKEELINVAGSKVHPAEVESHIVNIEGVAMVRVRARKSSIAGQLVEALVVIAPGYHAEAVVAAIHARCGEALVPYKRPRFVTVVDKIEMSHNQKMIRGY